MTGTLVVVLGTVASFLSMISLMPQVVRTWRTRSAGDISLGWLAIALVSMVLWAMYGLMVEAMAIVWANALTFVQASFILAIKLRTLRTAAARLPSAGPLS